MHFYTIKLHEIQKGHVKHTITGGTAALKGKQKGEICN